MPEKNRAKIILPKPEIETQSSQLDIWLPNGKPSLSLLGKILIQSRLPEAVDIKKLLLLAGDLFSEENSLLRLHSPVNVFGDIRGQNLDLHGILKNAVESPGETPFLFLGNYSSRGKFGLETLLYLCALKTHYPDKVFLLRGTSETRVFASRFFDLEVKRKTKSEYLSRLFLKLFNRLPLAAIIDNKFFCAHGSFGAKNFFDEIENLNRVCEPKVDSLVFKMLWGTPVKEKIKTRDCRRGFTKEELVEFLSANKLSCLIRSHDPVKDGFQVDFEENSVPRCITLFSAPNFCNLYGNKGAFLRIDAKNCICNSLEKNKFCELGKAYHELGLTFATYGKSSEKQDFPELFNCFDISAGLLKKKLCEKANKRLETAIDMAKLEDDADLQEFYAFAPELLQTSNNEIIKKLKQKNVTNRTALLDLGFDEIKKIDETNELVSESEMKVFVETDESSMESYSKSYDPTKN